MTGAILFDLDGTLIDSDRAIVWCVNQLLAKHGFSPAPPARIVPLIGIGLTPLLGHFFEKPETLVPEYRALYREGFSERTIIYPNAVEMLSGFRAKGIKAAIVTNRNDELAGDIIKSKGIYDLFDALVGENGSIALKPDPAMVFEACRLLRAEPKHCLMVGDTEIDVLTGVAAGCRTAFFARGRANMDFGADFVINDLAELSRLIDI